jgi:hypothetical protein
MGNRSQNPAAAEFFGVVHNRFDAKDAFAFGIDLQSQLAEVDLENDQVILRCLDHGF